MVQRLLIVATSCGAQACIDKQTSAVAVCGSGLHGLP